MMKRALVVGSQVDGLAGVENDAAAMKELLESRGFAVDHRIGDRATRAGILAGYDALSRASGAGDAAVIYYAGHGFFSLRDPDRPWQCIVPVDVRAGGDDDWRGITSWELSIKQAQLTDKTKNVTVILDCCNASEMFRTYDERGRAATGATRAPVMRDGSAAPPPGLPFPSAEGFARHLEQLHTHYGADAAKVHPLGNASAVRLVASGRTDYSYEMRMRDGRQGGLFTWTLLEVLREVGDCHVSWAMVMYAVRARMRAMLNVQRPEVEGPLRRVPFSLLEIDSEGVPVRPRGEALTLQAGKLQRVTVGDVYGLMPAGSPAHEAGKGLGEVEVTEVRVMTSSAKRTAGAGKIPVDALAFPIRKLAPRWPVRVVGTSGARPRVERELSGSSTLRVAEEGEASEIATVRLAGDELTIEDGQSLLFPAVSVTEQLSDAIHNLTMRGDAQRLRQMEGAHGVHADEIAVELGVVEGGRQRPIAPHGAALGLGDRIYVQVKHAARRRLYVHVFNVGLRGKISLLTRFAPAGVALDRGDAPLILGQTHLRGLAGLGLAWPDRLPRVAPRLDEIFIVAATTPGSLAMLETREVLEDDADLTRRRDVGADGEVEELLVQRLSYELHPVERRLGGGLTAPPAGQASEPASAVS
jgi:Caspase domain